MATLNEALVNIIVADYVGVDAAAKVNILGGGFSITSVQPTGLTAPQHVVAIVDLPPDFAGQQVGVTLELRDHTTGNAARMIGPSGQPEALRISQLVKIEAPQIPGYYLPPDMPCRTQVALAFPNGLQLEAGHHYAWHVRLDDTTSKGWRAQFHVAGPPPPPVFGGPAGPSNIEGVFGAEPEDRG